MLNIYYIHLCRSDLCQIKTKFKILSLMIIENIISMPHSVLKMALGIDIILAQAVFIIHYGAKPRRVGSLYKVYIEPTRRGFASKT